MASPLSLITALEHIRILTYFHVSSVALLVFDYFLTFTREVSLIWPARWTVIKILFLLTRYMPFFELGIILHYHFQQHPKAETCYLIYKVVSWLFYIGTALPEIMLTLRTWAVWNRDRRLGIGLPIFFLLCWGPAVKLVLIFINGLSFMPLKSPALIGCLVTKGSNIATVTWSLLLVYEGALFFLMLIKAVQCYKITGRSQLFDVVFGNGLLYYMYLFVLALINLIVSQTTPPSLKLVLTSTECVLHAMLGCRVVLDIRGEVYDKKYSCFVDLGPCSPSRDPDITDTGVCASGDVGRANSSSFRIPTCWCFSDAAVGFAILSCTIAYVYDYLLTFPREVSLIWPSPWTVIKILFLSTRYIPFIDGALLLYYHFQQHQTDKTCSALYKTISWPFYIGKGLPEIILTLRTLAVWNRDRRLSIGLAIIFVACFLPITGEIFVFLESVEGAITLLTSPVLLGCVLSISLA